MPRYFFDVTDIARYLSRERTISGIQRAATMIIYQISTVLDADDVFLTYYDDKSRKQLVISARQFFALDHFDTYALSGALSISATGNLSQCDSDYLYKYRDQRLKQTYHRLRFDLEAARKNETYFKRRNLTIEQWKESRRAPQKKIKPVSDTLDDYVRPGDVICLLGAFWGDSKLERQLLKYKADGAQIYILIHDMIPMLFPETVTVNPEVFHDWLVKSLDYCAGYFANSESTGRDLRAFLAQRDSNLPVHVTPLAQSSISDLDASDVPAASNVYDFEKTREIFRCRPDVREAFKTPYVLAVGTLEARKNCWRQAQAWYRLSRETGFELPRLVFAGKKGWLNDDFFEAYEATGGWGGWVRIVEQPSDRDLQMLYERCEFTLYASLYEGWGLPIGEGLSYGKTGVVSDVSSMPEVGGDMVEYCNPHSIDSIAAACRRLLTEPGRKQALEQSIAHTRLRQWSDVSRDVGQVLLAAGQSAAA